MFGQQSNKTRTLLPSDPTEASAPPGEASVIHYGGLSAGTAAGPCVALVEGSGPCLRHELQELMRLRLRTATLVIAAGFAAFLFTNAFRINYSRALDVQLFGLHATATVLLALLASILSRRRNIPLAGLHLAEWLTFGLPAALFLVSQYFLTIQSCQRGMLDFPEGFWLILIYTYALFIPNTLWRAAAGIGLICLAPMTLLVIMMWTNPVVSQNTTNDQIARLALMFALAGVGGLLGVDVIGSLRREAFEARQLGQYKLTRRIGAGGMGEVYLAEHRLLKRPCVVKLIRPDRTGNPNVLARFQREVRATAKLSHWNTIEVFDYGSTADGTFYYVMEYLPGMNLGEIVDRFGPMPAERVIYLLRQVCDALAEAHSAGLIHRDIKPANIFAAQRGGVYDVAKLLDFGLVKPIFAKDPDEPIHLTAEGTITGSPLFISPEQALGEVKPDARSDIYSLGAVAYYLLTGLPPFAGDKALKVIFAHAHDPVTPPSEHQPDVPPDLEAVVLRCLAKSPADRFQSAAELSAALSACESADLWNRQLAAEWWRDQGDAARQPEPTAAE
jgi:tRNA A-37 threonylcarbamoyl transferase component Bud32